MEVVHYGKSQTDLSTLLDTHSWNNLGVQAYTEYPRGYLRWTLAHPAGSPATVGRLAWKQWREWRYFILRVQETPAPLADSYFAPAHPEILKAIPARIPLYHQACSQLALRRWHRILAESPLAYMQRWREALPPAFVGQLLFNAPVLVDYDTSRGGAVLLRHEQTYLVATPDGPVVLDGPLPRKLTLAMILETWNYPSYPQLLALHRLLRL